MAAAVSLGLMLCGVLLVSVAALVEHYSKRSNLVMRCLNRWAGYK